MNLATWSIRKPIPSIVLFLVFSIVGLWGFQKLHVQYMPDLTLPSIRVRLTQPGAAPAQLETQVARKVEDALAPLPGVKHLETTITEGTVQLTARFEVGQNLSDALIEVKDAVDHMRVQLPPEMEPASITSIIPFNDPVMRFAVRSSKLDQLALSWFVDDTLAKAFGAIPGLGRFERIGGLQREVCVELAPTQLIALGVTARDVNQALKAAQIQATAGRSFLASKEEAVRIISTAAQAADLEALPLALPDGRKLRLDQVATVSDVGAEATQIAMLDGAPVVGINLYRAPGQDELRFDEDVRRAVKEMTAFDPSLSLQPITNDTDYTREEYRGSMSMLYEGAFLAVLVVWLFLRDWRATLIAASAMPLSILPVFAVMYLLGFSLNTLSLLALAAVIGILVDDAIVEIENIERHLRGGRSVLDATSDAVQEIALAVLATTLTLAAVFVPTALMRNVPGLFFREFGWTAAIAVLSSLLVARLLTPMMAAYFMTPGKAAQSEAPSRVRVRYLALVRWCLNHRAITLMLTVMLFAFSLAVVPLIPTGLLPAVDRSYINVTLELPPGTRLEDTEHKAEQARLLIARIGGVQHVMVSLGSGDKDHAGTTNMGILTIVLSDPANRKSQTAIEAALRTVLASVPGARFSIGGGNDDNQLELIVASDDDAALHTSARRLENALRELPGLAHVTSSDSLERPELVIRPMLVHAAELGVTPENIADTVRVAVSGDVDTQLTKLNLDNRQIPISVRMPAYVSADMAALAQIRLHGHPGEDLVALGEVASMSIENGPSQIDRYDRRRYITLTDALEGMPLGTALAQAKALPVAKSLPPEVTMSEAGNADEMNTLLSGFLIAIVSGVICVYCLLVLLFNDFFQPLTILTALPLALGGAFLSLLSMGGELNVPSLIGVVMLMGIVTKNSILLVEHALSGMRQRALHLNDALIDACRHRARPIVMTSVAMIAGMLPIGLGFGADAGFRRPMAIAVIGGLIVSTLLSLLVVPVVFNVVARSEFHLAKFSLRRWLRRSITLRFAGAMIRRYFRRPQ